VTWTTRSADPGYLPPSEANRPHYLIDNTHPSGERVVASFQSKSMCQAFAALANRNAAELEMLRQEAMPPAAQVLAELGAAMEAGS